MKDPDQPISPSRRKFLRDAGVSGGLAAAATAAPGIVAAETSGQTAEHSAGDGYRLTEHILAYYKSAAS